MKYTRLANEIPYCTGCRKPRDGTIVAAHRNLNSWGLKAGKGVKTIPALCAFLCFECHQYMDGEGRKDYQFAELAVHRTITWAFENGHLLISGRAA